MNTQQAGNEKRKQAAAKLWNARKAEIEWLYNDQGYSQSRIAAYFNVCQQAIQRVMKRLGIKPRSTANHGKRNGRFKDGSQSRGYRTVITKDKCRKCGATNDLGIHHKNDDHFDNRLDNLEVLCNSCHMSITKKKWWDAKKSGNPLPKSNGPVGWKR